MNETVQESTQTNQTQQSQSIQSAPPATTPPAEPKKRGSYLSGKTTALILVLAAAALFFLFLAITPQTPQQEPSKKTAAMPTPIVNTVLAMEDVSTSSALTTKTVQVTIDTQKNSVNVVQLELSFDPTIFNLVTITPGNFMPNPVELTKGIDYKNGRISYALGIAPSAKAVQGKGTLVTIVFQVQPGATSSSTVLSFLPKTLVGAAGINGSALKSAKGITINLPITPQPKATATPLQTASPSSTVKN